MSYICVAKQWLPESMEWKECVEGEYPTFEQARKRAVEISTVGVQGYVARPSPENHDHR